MIVYNNSIGDVESLPTRNAQDEHEVQVAELAELGYYGLELLAGDPPNVQRWSELEHQAVIQRQAQAQADEESAFYEGVRRASSRVS